MAWVGYRSTQRHNYNKKRSARLVALPVFARAAERGMSMTVDRYADPKDEGNSSFYHTGKSCIEKGCNDPAGTAWSPYWCFQHNVERMNRVGKSLKAMLAKLEQQKPQESGT
jgi:hypothetical protein